MPENTPAFFIFCTSLAKIYVLIKIRYHTKKPSGSANSDSAFICYLCPSATAIKTSIGSY